MGTAPARERKPPIPAPGNETAARDGLTPRAFGIGLVLCGLMCLGLTYNRMITQGSFLGGGYYMDRGALFVLFLLVVAANPLLGVIKKRFVLSRGELLAIYTMFLILLPAWVMTKPVILYTTGTTYHATPELRHIEAVPPHLLPWLVPQGEGIVRDLYEGLPKGGSIPWLGWVLPLWSWGSFLIVLFVVLVCIGVLMRRQWEEHERFAFPLMQVPLAMLEPGKGRFAPVFRSRLLAAGFGIPALVGVLRGLRYYFPNIPIINLGTHVRIFRRTMVLPFKIHFLVLGYSYFINLDVSFSLWVINLITKVVRGALAMVGAGQTWGVSGVVGRYSSQGSEFLAMMGMGYILALAAYSLYVARGHLRHVWTKIRGGSSHLKDSDEIIPYRTAVLGIVLGVSYLGLWLYQSGIAPPLVVFLLVSSLTVFFVMARIVSETGFVATYSPINPSEFVVCAVGSSAFSPAGLATLGISYIWTMTRRNTLMPHALGALRLAREIGRKRGLVWAMGAALALGLVATGFTTLNLGYTHGGVNIDYPWFSNVNDAASPFDEFIGRRLLEPSPVFKMGFLYTALGTAVAAVLILLRMRLPWWPFHPAALPLSTVWYMDWFGFSVFLAWGIKAVILRVGGADLYRKARPFFIGMILGEVMCSGGWSVVSAFTGRLKTWPFMGYWNSS